MSDWHIPDRGEKGVRFGCGFLLGAVLGFIGAAFNGAGTVRVAALVAGGAAVLGGTLAVRYGDRFWYALRHLFWFWP